MMNMLQTAIYGILFSAFMVTAIELSEQRNSQILVFRLNNYQSHAETRIPHFDDYQVITSLIQMEYNTRFSLKLNRTFSSVDPWTDVFRVSASVNSISPRSLQWSITVRSLITHTLSNVYLTVLTLSSSQPSRQISIPNGFLTKYCEYVVFVLGFSDSTISNNTAISKRDQKTLTSLTRNIETSKPSFSINLVDFKEGHWIQVSFLIMDTNQLMCDGVSILTYGLQSTNYQSAKVKYINGVEPILGITSAKLVVGSFKYNPNNLTVLLKGKGRFQYSIAYINLRCFPLQPSDQQPIIPDTPPLPKITVQNRVIVNQPRELYLMIAILIGLATGVVAYLITYLLLSRKRYTSTPPRRQHKVSPSNSTKDSCTQQNMQVSPFEIPSKPQLNRLPSIEEYPSQQQSSGTATPNKKESEPTEDGTE